MANTQKYLSHLMQNIGITPACSEEERAASADIAKIFENHGFNPEVQEFSTGGNQRLVEGVLGAVVFVGAVLMGISGPVGVVGMLLALAAAILFALERAGKPVLSGLGRGGLSQNVIAYHKASGPLASPRNRPVVIVAHYDSPRADLMSQEPLASYRPVIVKLFPIAMVAVAVLGVVHAFPLPAAAKVVLWVLSIIVALVPLAVAVSAIANRFFLPYTSGSVCNKSSVAAMLGVMDSVSPFQGGEEFPEDVPAEEYFAEQRRIVEEAAEAAAAAAAAAQAEALAYPTEGADEEGAEAEVEADETEGEEDTEAPEFVSIEETGVMEAVDAGGDEGSSGAEADETVGFEVLEPSSTVSMPAPVSADDQIDADLEIHPEEEPAADGTEPNDATSATRAFSVVDGTGSEEDGAAEAQAEPLSAASSVDAEGSVEGSSTPAYRVNAEGNYRYGEDAIRELGMLSASCAIDYEDEDADFAADDEPTAFDVRRPDDSGETAPAVDDEDMGAEQSAFWDEDDEEFDGFMDEDGSFEEDSEEISHTVAEADAPEDEADRSLASEESQADVEFVEAEYEQVDDADSEPLDADEGLSSDVAQSDEVESDSVVPDEESLDPVAEDEDEDSETAAASEEQVASAPVEEDASAGAELPLDKTVAAPPLQPEPADPGRTVAMPATAPAETVDSLMAEISSPMPRRRDIPVPDPSASTPAVPATNRTALFDLPDPASSPVDPFASPSPYPERPASAAGNVSAAHPGFEIVPPTSTASETVVAPAPFDGGDQVPDVVSERIETISAPAPAPEPKKRRRGLGGLFGRKKKKDESMSDWLGVDDDFDARRSGGDIGSWDNFDDDDFDWKGGAASYGEASEAELREAITSMGDDELLGHDIWFVATGASESGNAGIRAFLDTHRSKLRGVFLINLESVGAGRVVMLSTEGDRRVLKGDRRIQKLVSQVSADFHNECGAIEMPYVTTDAHVAMSMSLRALTLAGVEQSGFALARTEEDQPYNVDPDNVQMVSDVVTEVIRRS